MISSALRNPITVIVFIAGILIFSVLALLSGRSVTPCNERPANAPRERDQVSISAVSNASVSAVAWRPTGPAATDASVNVTFAEIAISSPEGLPVSDSTVLSRESTRKITERHA